MKSKQYSFLKPISHSFGGTLQKGKRKSSRPIDPKSTLHLVLKSSRATGEWSLLKRRHKTRIHVLLIRLARENGVKVYRYENVGNHLHLLIKTKNRSGFQKFLRIFSGRIAQLITGARKGNPQGKFWDSLAFTRIVQWGRDFKRMTHYFIKNELESLGHITLFAKNLCQRGILIFESN
jgi:REP element-mobilizing transposase RayT